MSSIEKMKTSDLFEFIHQVTQPVKEAIDLLRQKVTSMEKETAERVNRTVLRGEEAADQFKTRFSSGVQKFSLWASSPTRKEKTVAPFLSRIESDPEAVIGRINQLLEDRKNGVPPTTRDKTRLAGLTTEELKIVKNHAIEEKDLQDEFYAK